MELTTQITQADIEYLGDVVAVGILVICFFMGFIAGGMR